MESIINKRKKEIKTARDGIQVQLNDIAVKKQKLQQLESEMITELVRLEGEERLIALVEKDNEPEQEGFKEAVGSENKEAD